MMKEQFLNEIRNHDSNDLPAKYSTGKVYENAAVQQRIAEFCQIAEKITGLKKTEIPFLVERQFSSPFETYNDPGRKSSGKNILPMRMPQKREPVRNVWNTPIGFLNGRKKLILCPNSLCTPIANAIMRMCMRKICLNLLNVKKFVTIFLLPIIIFQKKM